MIKILIDSASDISLEEAKKMGVNIIPLIVRINNKDYYDGVDLTPKQFYDMLIEYNELPKTSQITPFRYVEKYKELTADGSTLLVITISSKLSGTYASAVAAVDDFPNVYVVDSLNACIGERLLCEYALKLINDNLDINNIVDELNNAKKRINVIAMLNTLEYLKKGGRISGAAAFIGSRLSLKPVIGVVNGSVKLLGKAIGSKKGKNLLNSLVEEKGIDFTMPFGTVYSGLDDSLLTKYIEDSESIWKSNTDNVPKYIIGTTIGTHVGPNGIGVAFFEKKS